MCLSACIEEVVAVHCADGKEKLGISILLHATGKEATRLGQQHIRKLSKDLTWSGNKRSPAVPVTTGVALLAPSTVRSSNQAVPGCTCNRPFHSKCRRYAHRFLDESPKPVDPKKPPPQ